MFAIFETGGKQYKVQKNDIIYVEKLEKNEGEAAKFDNGLMVDGKFGAPFNKGASVTCKVEKQRKQKKINMIKHKRYRRMLKRRGDRQAYSKLSVVSIDDK